MESFRIFGKLKSNNNPNKMSKCPPAAEEIVQFKNDLFLLIKYFEFKNVHNDFQMKLRDDIKVIEASNEIFVSGNKSRYVYKLKKLF